MRIEYEASGKKKSIFPARSWKTIYRCRIPIKDQESYIEMRNSVNFQRLLVTDGQIQCRLMPFLIDSYLNAQQSPYPRERKGRCNPNLRKDPIPSAVLFLFEGKKPLLLADPAPGQGNNDQAQGERPSDLYGTDGTASLTACAASIDTSESWVGSAAGGKINLESCL